MSFVGVFSRPFASFKIFQAASTVTALATRRSTFGVIGSWFLGFQATTAVVVTFGIPREKVPQKCRQRLAPRYSSSGPQKAQLFHLAAFAF